MVILPQGLTGIKPNQQRLILGGAQLQSVGSDVNFPLESGRLEDVGVKDGSTISLLLRVCGGMPATAPRIKMPVSYATFFFLQEQISACLPIIFVAIYHHSGLSW